MPEYANMKRLDLFVPVSVAELCTAIDGHLYRYSNRLMEWCTSRMKSPQGYDFLRQTFLYDPDKRLTAYDALKHKWFQEDPVPTQKYVLRVDGVCLMLTLHTCSAFQSLQSHSAPPHRRITHDDAPSMMPLPTQAQATQNVAQAQGVHGMSLSHSMSAKSMSGRGSAGSVGTGVGTGGAGGNAGSGRTRKKARVG